MDGNSTLLQNTMANFQLDRINHRSCLFLDSVSKEILRMAWNEVIESKERGFRKFSKRGERHAFLSSQ